MTKFPLTFLTIILGLAIGSVFRYAQHSEGEVDQVVAASSAPQPGAISESGEEVAEHKRPTLDEVINAQEPETVRVLSLYLKEASVKEIAELMVSVFNENRKLAPYMWMIALRGAQLDPHAVISELKDQEYLLKDICTAWCAVDPIAAFRAGLQAEGALKDLIMQSLNARAATLTEEELAQVLELATASNTDLSSMEVIETLNWRAKAKVDVRRTLSEILAIEDKDERKRGSNTVLNTWLDDDPLMAAE